MQLGYFQVIAEPVSTWVQEIFEFVAAAVAALGDEVVDAALALGVARIPVLHRRVLDLGVVERDELDHRGVKLVLVALRRGAAFEVAHVGALVGDDQRALELAGVLLVDAEIGRQLHRAAHARRHVDERAVGEHRRVQRREEVVRGRHHGADVLLHEVGMLAQRLRDRHEDHAGLLEFRLECGCDRNRSRTPHRPRPCGCRCRPRFAIGVIFRLVLDHARQNLLLAQRNAELLVGPENFRVDLVERLRAGLLLRRRVVIEVLVVDLVVVHPRPVRLLHGEPAAIGVETPRQHPFRLVLLGRNEPDRVLGKALRGLVGLDVGDEPVFVLVDVDAANPLDRLLDCRHSSLRSRGQGPWVGLSVMVVRFPGWGTFRLGGDFLLVSRLI